MEKSYILYTLTAVLPWDSSSSEVKREGKCLGTVGHRRCHPSTPVSQQPNHMENVPCGIRLKKAVSATHSHLQFTFPKIYLYVQTLVQSSREKTITQVCSASVQPQTAHSQTDPHFLQKHLPVPPELLTIEFPHGSAEDNVTYKSSTQEPRLTQQRQALVRVSYHNFMNKSIRTTQMY